MSGKEETALKRAILDALHRLGIEAWNSPAGQVKARRGYIHMAPEGTPDIVGYMPDGRLLGIEVKAPRSTASATKPERREKQKAWRDRAEAAGCVVAEVRSVAEAVEAVRRAG